MDSKELRLLGEAYAKISESQTENIQEGEYDDAVRERRSATEMQRRAQDEARRRRMRNQPGGFAAGDPEDKVKKESSDLFDIVKGHLMSEGYADTEEAALAIMANMSEEWRQSIVDSCVMEAPYHDPGGSGTLADVMRQAGMNNAPVGQGSGYRPAPAPTGRAGGLGGVVKKASLKKNINKNIA